jgi:hypothetical protein
VAPPAALVMFIRPDEVDDALNTIVSQALFIPTISVKLK